LGLGIILRIITLMEDPKLHMKKYDREKEDEYVKSVMDEQNQRVLTHQQCRQMSLEELERYDFQGYDMPLKYKRRVNEYREAYEIDDPEAAQDDYNIGVMQGKFERAK
jgi:hypothetical protein